MHQGDLAQLGQFFTDMDVGGGEKGQKIGDEKDIRSIFLDCLHCFYPRPGQIGDMGIDDFQLRIHLKFCCLRFTGEDQPWVLLFKPKEFYRVLFLLECLWHSVLKLRICALIVWGRSQNGYFHHSFP